MILSLIAAMSQNRVIGLENKMPWHISADLKYFKKITLNHPIIVGRKTFESWGGKPLPQRRNLIVSRNVNPQMTENCEYFTSLEDALSACAGDDEVFIVGGEQIYRQALPKAQRVYLTIIDKNVNGDTFFPELPDTFREVSCQAGEENGLQFWWKVFESFPR